MVVQVAPSPHRFSAADGAQKAGCQAAQTAVAQRGLVFRFLNGGEFMTVLASSSFCFVKQAQIDQVVAEQLADQKFCRHIACACRPLGALRPAAPWCRASGQYTNFPDRWRVQIFAVVCRSECSAVSVPYTFPSRFSQCSIWGVPGLRTPATARPHSTPGQSSPGGCSFPVVKFRQRPAHPSLSAGSSAASCCFTCRFACADIRLLLNRPDTVAPPVGGYTVPDEERPRRRGPQ